jgi:hypothetical protein
MKISSLLLIAFAILVSIGCGVNKQVQQMKSFGKNEFRLLSVDSTTLAGVDVQHVNQLSDLSTVDKARILASFASGTVPLYTSLLIETRNKSSEENALNKLEWKLLLDGNEIANGISNERIIVPADSTVAFRLPVNSDVRKLLKKDERDAVINLALGLADLSRNPARITVKVKPTFIVAGKEVKYPGFVNIDKELNKQEP